MSAAAVLARVRAAGLTLSLNPERSGHLLARPADRLTPELRALILAHKPELLAELRGGPLPGERVPRHERPTPEVLAAWGEYLLERAAVMEFGTELPRAEADRRAWTELLTKYPAAAAYFGPGAGHA